MVTISRIGAIAGANQADNQENYASVAVLADGGYVVAYNSGTSAVYSEAWQTSITYQDVYVSRYNAAGQLISSAKVDSLNAPSRYVMKPDVVALSGGGFVVGYMEESLGYQLDAPRADSYQEYIRFRIYNADGLANATEFGDNASAPYSAGARRFVSDPSLASGADNTFALSYYSNTFQGDAVYANTRNGSGPYTFYPSAVYEMTAPTATASLTNGSIALVWCGNGADGDGSSAGIFLRLVDAAGVVVVAEAQVNSNNVGAQYRPDMTALATGGFVVLWASTEGGVFNVKGQLYTALGQRAGTEFLVTADNGGYGVSVAAFDGGGFVAVWQTNLQVFAQRYLGNGAKDGDQILIGDTAYYAEADVSTFADGGFVVSWTRDNDGDGDPDIATRVIGARVTATTATAAVELIEGGSGADVLRAAPGAFGAGDQINLGGGVDELRLTAAGTLDLTVPNVFKGVEKLVGTTGNDTFIVSQERLAGITAYSLGGGTDTFRVVGSDFTLNAAANVTRLAVADAASNITRTITGNAFSQHISGAAGSDFLRGLGGDDRLDGLGGIDILVGGAGDDAYYVDNQSDAVRENVGEGLDTVYALGGYSLAAGYEIEVLRTRDDAGLADVTLRGNEFAQTIFGNAGANTIDGGGGADIMRGFSGNDTYIVDNAGDRIVEAAGAGNDIVYASVSHVLDANVENLALLGVTATNGTGNASANQIYGNNAANRIDGRGGADVMIGAGGNDTYTVDSALDQVTEYAGEGTDLVYSSITYTLGDNLENLTLTGSAALNGTGNAFANFITGTTGKNILDGRAGADTMRGFAGDDTYYVDMVTDKVVEAANSGTDSVFASVSYVLAVNVENLTLTGDAAINGTGNALANMIKGNAAANVLNGLAGADRMEGLAGDDSYYVDNSGDVVVEAVGGGTDTVYASVTHTLAANVDNLTLTGSAALNGTGNGLANFITGNNGANVVNGGGGADIMRGLGGDDSYYVDDVADRVVEVAGGGTDTVYAFVSHTLAANVENLFLVGDALNGTGNALANAIRGNASANTLNGLAGADTMRGEAGDDIYVVDDANDKVVEVAGEGTDTVNASVSHTLALNVENLTLTGSAAINGTGNLAVNVIIGNGGANVLNGGLGADQLTGGSGADSFVFSTALGASNIDRITDFSVPQDTIHLDDAIFRVLPPGALAVGAFNIGTSAQDEDHRIIYNSASGALFYDADGLGGAAQQQFAVISAGLALTAADFRVV